MGMTMFADQVWACGGPGACVQARAASTFARRTISSSLGQCPRMGTPVLFSGAIAANAMAPWTEPATVTCYAAEHLELDTPI